MPEFEVLASDCDPDPDCPKVLRIAPGQLVVVGAADPARAPDTVTISGALYDRTLAAAELRASQPPVPDVVAVTGIPISAPSLLADYGVAAGEGAVQVSETAFLQAGTAIRLGA